MSMSSAMLSGTPSWEAPLTTRRMCRRAAGGVAALALALLAVPAPDQAGPSTGLLAVVSYDGALPTVSGVDVRTVLPAVGAAVVRADAEALSRLAATDGVRGVVPDAPMRMTGGLAEKPSGGVLAPLGLGREAGRPWSGSGVRVAVVDTGVSDSAALDRASGRLVDAVDTRLVDDGGDPVDVTDRRSGSAPLDDDFGHGTFMASLVAGGPVPGSEGRSVGVAPGATVLVVRVADADGTTSLSQVVAGLDWVAAHPDQVDVASLSFGRERPGRGYGSDPLTDAVAAVQEAGVSVVVAAGNVADEVSDPGFLPQVLTVGSADVRSGELSARSGSGWVAGVRKPDLVASGVSVLGVLPPDSVIAQEHPESRATGDLWLGSGTSQATAVTSGAVALLLDRYPDATPAQVKVTLREAAIALPERGTGEGLLQLGKGLCGEPDGTDGEGNDLTGTADLNEPRWAANSWSANSWSANSWSANSWSANSWSANSWSANSWSSAGWGAP